MDNNLYRQFASYYAAITKDRDFEGQLSCILTSFKMDNPCTSFLELFAGPATHSLEAIKKGDIDVWAIDSSRNMKKLAIEHGFKNPDQYIVGNMPDSIAKAGNIQFDCITCLYHGLSNLSMQEVFEAFTTISQLLKPKGKIFLEIHDIHKIMEYISSDQDIHYQKIIHSNGEQIDYAWPSGKIRWNPYNFNAVAPIRLLIKTDQRLDTLEFSSEDRIYSTEDIVFIGNLTGFKCRIMNTHPLWHQNFEHSIMLELTHKI